MVKFDFGKYKQDESQEIILPEVKIQEEKKEMPIKQLGIEIQCNCGQFMRILNNGKEETIIYECPKCKIKVHLRLRLGLII
ncbi:hypothetical protein ES703_11022 [subsurface metagenome]